MSATTGQLDRRVTFERSTASTNLFGEAVMAWTPYVETWTRVEHLSDGERLRAGALEVEATVTTRFVVRWNDYTKTINPKDRLVFESRTYDIHHCKEVGRREFVEVSARARAE